LKVVTTILTSCIRFAAGNVAKIECNTLFTAAEALPTVSRVKLPMHTTRAQRSLTWISSCDVCCVIGNLAITVERPQGRALRGWYFSYSGGEMQRRLSWLLQSMGTTHVLLTLLNGTSKGRSAVWLHAATAKFKTIALRSNFYCSLTWRAARFSQKCVLPLPLQRSLQLDEPWRKSRQSLTATSIGE